MASEWTFLGIFIYKEKLIMTSCIANQFYLEKINQKQDSKLLNFGKQLATKSIIIYFDQQRNYQICMMNLAQDFHLWHEFFSFDGSHSFNSNFLDDLSTCH